MNEELTPAQWLDAAVELLDYALADRSPDTAVQALADVGQAAAKQPVGSLATAPELAGQWGRLRELAQRDPYFIGTAVTAVVEPVRNYGDKGLSDALFARSGYQVLLDLGVWPEPPLDAFNLGEVDEELADAVAEAPPAVPDGVPSSHTWWQPPR